MNFTVNKHLINDLFDDGLIVFRAYRFYLYLIMLFGEQSPFIQTDMFILESGCQYSVATIHLMV